MVGRRQEIIVSVTFRCQGHAWLVVVLAGRLRLASTKDFQVNVRPAFLLSRLFPKFLTSSHGIS